MTMTAHDSTARPTSDPVYVAVGIPNGVIYPADSAFPSEAVGAVRRGGEVVFVDLADYRAWTLLLAPMRASAGANAFRAPAPESFTHSLERLTVLGLVVGITSWESAVAVLRKLRPLPLGFAVGNSARDPERFTLRSPTVSGDSLLAVDPLENVIWSEFDGSASLESTVADVTARLPDLDPAVVLSAATELVLKLMKARLLYLDAEDLDAEAHA
jgi:hypothetical protein